MRRLAHATRGFLKHALAPESFWEFQPGEQVIADGLPGKVESVSDGPVGGNESYQVVLDNGLGGGEYNARQLSRPPGVTASATSTEAPSVALEPVQATSESLASFHYPELGTILFDRLPNENLRVYAARQVTAAGQLPDDVSQQPEDGTERGEDLNVPDVCSWCGNPGPWTDEQDTGRGTRIRCGTCGGTMRLNADEDAGTTGIQWAPELANSPQNHPSRMGDPRATIHDPRAVHGVLNIAASAEAGYTIFDAPSLLAQAEAQIQVTAASLGGFADEEFVFQFTASWADVQKKAKRIRAEGGVRIVAASHLAVVGEVQGDTAVYETALNYVVGAKRLANWECGCRWAAYAWGRSPAYRRFEGRLCSHALALQYEASSRGMFGQEVTPDRYRMPGQRADSPVVVQYQRPTERQPERAPGSRVGPGDLSRRQTPPANMRSQWEPGSRVRHRGKLGYQYEDVPPSFEWARLLTALGNPPARVLDALMALGLPHTSARQAIDWATKSEASAEFEHAGVIHRAFHIGDDGMVVTYEGMVLPATVASLVIGKEEQEATADPMGGTAEPGTDIPGMEDRDTTELKKKKHHLLHHTNDARQHAPDFGYGLPWGGGYAWCDQCNGSGCGHCGGTGQVAIGNGLPQDPSDASSTETPMPDQSVDAGSMIGQDSSGMNATGALYTADYTSQDFGAGNPAQPNQKITPHVDSPNPASTGFATSADPGNWVQPIVNSSWGRWEAAKKTDDAPSVAGVAVKAGDTGRVLMIQRSNRDEKDPARGTWEFPGGHREDGDTTSLHTGIREWEEEVGHPFPEGGHVSHVHRSGPYVLHTVVIPEESLVDFSNGRATVNPDDPDGDDHEQSAWWDPEHARKNPALRQELKGGPWNEIKKAAAKWTITDQNGGGHGELPERPHYQRPNGIENCRNCGIPANMGAGEISSSTGYCARCDNLANTVGDPQNREPLGGSTHAWWTTEQPMSGHHEPFSLKGWDPAGRSTMHTLSGLGHDPVTTASGVRGSASSATYKQATAGYNPPQVKEYEGEVGNPDHITRSERGDIPIGAVANLPGARGEIPGEHRNRQGADWEAFKADIAANGIREPIFVTVDHGRDPVLSEGNHRRDAAVELGLSHIPAEVRYFGHAEQQGTLQSRTARWLTIDEARAAGQAEVARTGKSAEQLLREGPSLQHDLDDLAMIFSGTLHDEPEGALPSTDGAEDEGVEGPPGDPTVAASEDTGPVPGIPLDRVAPWGYPESAADHPNPAVAQPPGPGSAVQQDEPEPVDDNPGGLFHTEGSIVQVPDYVPEEFALASQMQPVLAGFAQTAGFKALAADAGAGPEQGGGVADGDVPNDSDIARAARELLSKTAAKDFSYEEQRQLIEEGGGKTRARNFSDLKIAGTHYEKLGDDAPGDDEWLML